MYWLVLKKKMKQFYDVTIYIYVQDFENLSIIRLLVLDWNNGWEFMYKKWQSKHTHLNVFLFVFHFCKVMNILLLLKVQERININKETCIKILFHWFGICLKNETSCLIKICSLNYDTICILSIGEKREKRASKNNFTFLSNILTISYEYLYRLPPLASRFTTFLYSCFHLPIWPLPISTIENVSIDPFLTNDSTCWYNHFLKAPWKDVLLTLSLLMTSPADMTPSDKHYTKCHFRIFLYL